MERNTKSLIRNAKIFDLKVNEEKTSHGNFGK